MVTVYAILFCSFENIVQCKSLCLQINADVSKITKKTLGKKLLGYDNHVGEMRKF